MSSKHFTYELYDVETGFLLYVGRSVAPKARRRIFERRTGLSVTQVVVEHASLEEAQEVEKYIIEHLRPLYNKYLSSSPTRLGMANSEAHRKALANGNLGRKLSPEHKAKLWAERDRSSEANPFFGRKHTEEAKAKIRAAVSRQFATEESRRRHGEATSRGMRKCKF